MDFWATAVYDLRLSSREFWRLTPLQFLILCERKKVETWALRCDIAALHATVLNMFSKGKKYSAKDLIGDPPDVLYGASGKKREKRQTSPGEMVAAFKVLFPEKPEVKKNGNG